MFYIQKKKTRFCSHLSLLFLLWISNLKENMTTFEEDQLIKRCTCYNIITRDSHEPAIAHLDQSCFQ
jgi:hypothetical protein